MERYSTESGAIEIARLLRRRIYEAGETHNDRSTWTGAVQKALDEYREQQGWKKSEVLPPFNKELPEESRKDSFLLDFVVWRREIDGNKEGAWIACESEWNLDVASVLKDFHKLMSFRAPYKLMIYDVKASEKLAESCRSEFKKALAAFQWRIEDEIYIFIEFVKGERIANCYMWRPGGELHLLDAA